MSNGQPAIPPIEPIDPETTISRPQVNSIDAPVAYAPSTPSAVSQERPAERQRGKVPRRALRRDASDARRPRSLVTKIIANIDAARVALWTDDGPPYRGDIATDLPPGAYWLEVNRREELWVFQSHRVKSGLRFSVAIDGPDPFSLDYFDPLLLIVTQGLEDRRGQSLLAILKKVYAAVYDDTTERAIDAIALLCQLNEIDLYDVVDQMWAEEPGAVNHLLLKIPASFKNSDLDGTATVLRALESFARKPEEIYVDAFSSWVVHPNSFSRDEERFRAGLSNIQLVLQYDYLRPPRSLIVYADDVSESTEAPAGLPRYGPANLTYPSVLSKGTTPRLYEAKKAAERQIKEQTFEFIKEAFRQVATVLLSVFQAAHSIAKIEQMSAARGYKPRAERGPGEWRATFEGGSNMNEAAEAYELSSCGTPRGMGYYVEGVQFEGFKNGFLLDGKNWTVTGRMGRAMANNERWVEPAIRRQAERQLAVAARHGVQVEWRVADPKTAEMLRVFFRDARLPIRVEHFAP